MSHSATLVDQPIKDPTQTAHLYRILGLVLLLRPFGNLCLAWGTRQLPQALSVNPLAYLHALVNPSVSLGIIMLILATVLRIALLSLADLSVVLPLTATGYIISALLAKFILGEHISLERWAGTALIAFGILVVGSTARHTTTLIEAGK